MKEAGRLVLLQEDLTFLALMELVDKHQLTVLDVVTAFEWKHALWSLNEIFVAA